MLLRMIEWLQLSSLYLSRFLIAVYQPRVQLMAHGSISTDPVRRSAAPSWGSISVFAYEH